MKIVVFLLLCQLATSEEVNEELPKVTVKAPSGTYVGRTHRTPAGAAFNAFRGIPYAEPPVGDLRFRKPVPKPTLGKVYRISKNNSMSVCRIAQTSK